MTYIIFFVGYAIGAAAAAILMRPMKSWQDGYDSAKKTYNDWDKGFDTGFSAAREHFTDYSLGYKAGWEARELTYKEEGDGKSYTN